MAYFVVTEGLREPLLASAPAHIVNVSSAAHQGATLDFGDLQSAKGFGAMKVRANLPAACVARGSPPIACTPASSPRASATEAAA
jgi:hypothetical protein